MAWRHPAGHGQTKKLIASCAALGAGIEGLPDAPTFRFIPAANDQLTSFTNGESYGGPSNRGSIACGKPKPKHIKNWQPSRLDANPMYGQPMAGDSEALTRARSRYAMGYPEELRTWLADQAKRRRLSQQREKESEAA